jgi:hypothetical protein
MLTDKEQIEDLSGQLSNALARIKELEALALQLSTVKTSKNSHRPPSSDLARKNQSLRPKSDKSIGSSPTSRQN